VPVVSLKQTLDRALDQRYGVAAFNIINDLGIEAVLAPAEQERAPVILQTSVKLYGRTAGASSSTSSTRSPATARSR